jgi:hypothetical protein
MRPNDGPPPASRLQDRIDRLRGAVRAAPAWAKVLIALGGVGLLVLLVFQPAKFAALLLLAVIGYGAVSLWRGHRSLSASVVVALLAGTVTAVLMNHDNQLWVAAHTAPGFSDPAGYVPPHSVPGHYVSVAGWSLPYLLMMLALPLVVAVAHTRALSQRFVGCRTVALALGWALAPAVLAQWLLTRLVVHHDLAGGAVAGTTAVLLTWLLVLAVLAWRRGKAWQLARAEGRQRARASAGTGWPGAAGNGSSGAATGQGRTQAERTVRAAEGLQGQVTTAGQPARAGTDQEQPAITIAEAMTELEAMIGLERVKNQIRQLTSSGDRQDLLCVRPAGAAGGRGGAARRPGGRVPRRHGDQDQRAGGLGARRRAVHRRGVQPRQRRRRPR